jgi:pilus assembly protein Flp/PilA
VIILEDAMIELMRIMQTLWKDEEGATAVEYGIMVALIAMVIIVAVALVGTNLSTLFNNVATHVPGS